MFHKIILSNILLLLLVSAFAQAVRGKIGSTDHEPLIGATVMESGTQNGTITDANGEFTLKVISEDVTLIVSFTGFQSDTLQADFSRPMHITLQEATEKLDEVVITSGTTFLDNLESRHTEVITEKELTKAACCNLSESFETNASVDVSYTDAISGAKSIRMLGLDGQYIQINRENIPHIRGLTGRYGLGFVPGTWIQSIDVGKGAGSVVSGYESMIGQLNLEFKKPENSETLYLNAYANSFGRMELNVNHAGHLNERWSGEVLAHANHFGNEIDQNKDGFLDLPKSRQINILSKFKYQGEKMENQIGINVMRDQKAGGQKGFGFGSNFSTSPQYGFVNNTTRVELFGKTGLLFRQKPYKGWGFIYSAAFLDIDGGFGRNNYAGDETTLYANSIFQNIIGNSFHQYKTGMSILYDQQDEIYADSTFSRKEVVPGIYYEYTYLPNDKFTLVAGARTDFHNLYGTYFTPRLHTRYQISEGTTIRASIGRGYRTPNPIMENSNVLVSSRKLIVEESPRSEISWNMGGSIVTRIPVKDKTIGLVGDYFYTTFENQLIYDMDQNSSELHVYNLDGKSFANSFQLEGSYQLTQHLGIKATYKYYNVKKTINGQLRRTPYVSKDRILVNTSYSTAYDKWVADATLQWFGSKRLPGTQDKSTEFQRQSQSPGFFLLNAQISRGFRFGSIYLGAENLFNFTQDDPITDAGNPFGSNFDASIVWAPVAGRTIYAGFRYKIKR